MSLVGCGVWVETNLREQLNLGTVLEETTPILAKQASSNSSTINDCSSKNINGIKQPASKLHNNKSSKSQSIISSSISSVSISYAEVKLFLVFYVFSIVSACVFAVCYIIVIDDFQSISDEYSPLF